MHRKAICLAGNTLVVSLPSKWVKQHHISKGDDILTIEKGSKLILQREEDAHTKDKEVDVSNTLPLTPNFLGALFKNGMSKVTLYFSHKEELEAIQNVIREEFIGFEVVNRGKNKVEIQSVSSLDRTQFPIIFRRLWLTLLTMAADISQALKKQDELLLNDIALTDKDVNKYSDFCRRLLNQHSYAISSQPLQLYYLIEQLEKIGDMQRDLSLLAIKKQPTHTVFFDMLHQFLRLLYDCYYRFSVERLLLFREYHQKLKQKIERTMSHANKKELPTLSLLLHLTRQVFDLNGVLISCNI